MDDKEQAAIDALLAAGLEAEAAAVRDLRRRHKDTMDAMHAAQRDSYKNGREDERERCAQLCEQIQRTSKQWGPMAGYCAEQIRRA